MTTNRNRCSSNKSIKLTQEKRHKQREHKKQQKSEFSFITYLVVVK